MSRKYKNSKEYWRDREETQRRKNIADEKEYAKEIKRIYQDAMDNIQKEIDSFYAKYATKEDITMAEAKKRVKSADIKAYERKARRYVEAAAKDRAEHGRTNKNASYFSEQANAEMRLYNLTMKVNRLEMLKANIGLELVNGFDELQKFYDDKLTERTLNEFERQAGILGVSVQNNQKFAHAIVNASFHNATFSERIWTHQDRLSAEIGKQLQIGLIQGKSSTVLARNIRELFDVSRSDAERLMATELCRVQTEVAKQSYERNGNTEYMFMAIGQKPCSICQDLNGQVFPVKDMTPGENAPPIHPRCHCATAPYWDQDAFDRWLDEENRRMHERMDTEAVANRPKSDIIMTDKQFGKKIGKHARDYGLNPSIESDREQMKEIISEIVDHFDDIRSGEWRGQPGTSDFYIRDDDVVVVNHDRFVTILKGGVNNARVKNARKREV